MTIDPRGLLDWYDENRRDLPWRADDVTPWQILVSEVMLQQTPVARVLGVWPAWVQRWPTPSATAAASAADLIRAWGRLGYPRRAVYLHDCAAVIADDFADVVPDDVATLRGLPGIGSYTAHAVVCFAYRRAVPVVDTNVRRVIARAVNGRADGGRPSPARELAEAAELLPDADRAPRFSAALMELGATVCTARAPDCGSCPLRDTCRWRAAGYPAATRARKPQRYVGTDRQARGRLLAVLRDNESPVERSRLDTAWPTDAVQRDRALESLLADGLVQRTPDGLFALPGHA